MQELRILLAIDPSLFREAVGAALRAEEGIEIVAEASDGLMAVAEAERTRPDAALVHADLPNCDGLRVTRLINERVKGCRVLVLSDQEDDSILDRAVTAGASGYITKEDPLQDLLAALRAVTSGETWIPARMLGTLLTHLSRRRQETSEALRRVSHLTRREKEVLALLAEGAGNDHIAQTLVISPQTARTHIQNLLGKLGVHSRLEAAAFVNQDGVRDELERAGALERSIHTSLHRSSM